MLDVFRNAAKGWTAKILMGLLIVAFGVWGIQDIFRGFHVGALATVGKQQISQQQFTEAFREIQQNYSRQTGEVLTAEQARLLGIDEQVLSRLMRDAAVDAEADRLKLAVSNEQLLKETAANPNFQNAEGKFDPEGFRDLLSRNGLNEATYFAGQRRNHLQQAIVEGVQASFVAPEVLTEALYRFQNEQRDARFFVVKAAESEIPAPGDADIKKQYDDNQVAYTAPEFRSIAIMKIDPEDIAAAQAVSDDDLKKGYERTKLSYYTPEFRTVLQITFPNAEEAKKAKDRIAAGTDFLAIAKERGLTESDATLLDNGEKGKIIDTAIADAAFALKQGEVSEPIAGRFATALLKVTAIVPEHQKALEEVKPDLTKRLQLEKAKDAVQSVYDAVEDGRGQQKSFEDISKSAQIDFSLIANVDASGNGPDGKALLLPHQEELLKAAFASDVGVENDALHPDDSFLWYEVRAVTPSALRPLDTVKDKVKSDLVAAKLRDLAADKAKKLVERAKAGAKLEDLAKEAGAEIKTAQGLKRNQPSADFDRAAVSALFQVPENGFTFAGEADGKGAKVIQSQPVLLPPFDPASADAKALAKTVGEQAAKDTLASYLDALLAQFGTTRNETLWRQITGLPTN